MAKFDPPEAFDFTNPSKWPEWKQRFERFRIATKLNKEDDDLQVSSLIYSMGSEAEHIYGTFKSNVSDNEDNFLDSNSTGLDYKTVILKFNTHFIPKTNIIHERAKFRTRTQKPGEGVECFIRALYDIAKNCNFGEAKDYNIRDSIVIGLSDKSVSQQLQMKRDLTLEVAIEKARHSEMIKAQNNETEAKSVSAVERGQRNDFSTTRPHNYKYNDYKKPQAQQEENKGRCSYCTYEAHPRHKCPASHKQCKKCKKMGHFAVACKAGRSVSEVVEFESEHDATTPNYFLGSVKGDSTEPPWRVNLRVNKKHINFKIDSGADVCIINETTFKGLKTPLLDAQVKLESPGGDVHVLGQIQVSTQHEGTTLPIRMFVASGMSDNLLSRDAAVKLNLIARISEVTSSIFNGIGTMKTTPVQIQLEQDAKPYSVNTPRRVPIPLIPKVKEEIERMEKEGVIVGVTEPTEWCAPMVPVIKPNGKVRICVDLRQLNKNVKREKYILPTIDDILHNLSKSSIFSSLDARAGYWQLPLDDSSSCYTTFITPVGRYRFVRLPFGISSASEIYQRKMVELLAGHEGVEIYQDDILIHGSSKDEHDERLDRVMKTILESGLKLNKEKCTFGQSQINFLGHTISDKGVKVHKEKVRAVQDMDRPTNTTELRQVMGMINYLGRYLPNLSEVAKPLTDLLKSDQTWLWGPTQEDALRNLKDMVSNSPVLAYYDVERPTVVSADASSYGLGGVLLQRHGDKLRPVAYCSRTLTDAERRYAQIEKECLASVWACEKFTRYLVGLKEFELCTDHKPLVPLINSKDIDLAPARCQRLLLRLMVYNANAIHVPGKELVVADALSRKPLGIEQDSSTEKDVKIHIDSVIKTKPMSDMKLQALQEATTKDCELQIVIKHTLEGWPRHKLDVEPEVRAYYQMQAELSVAYGLLLRNDRIVVPNEMREEMLKRIHDGHQGITKCRERAKQGVWWPGIGAEITKLVSECKHCQVHRPAQQHEMLITTPIPERPWQHIAVDLCYHKGKDYLVAVDYHSRYIEICHLVNTTTTPVINKLKNMFSRWGIPERVSSDNGPQFTAKEFKDFAQVYGFQHTTSSPYFPQANGEAERAVQTAKKLLAQSDPFLALLIYRCTPISATGHSPSELMLGRQIRNTLPAMPCKLIGKWPKQAEVEEKDERAKEGYAKYYNKRHGVTYHPPLNPGDSVRIKTDNNKGWDTTGMIVGTHNTPRSYIVQSGTSTYRRNRKHLLTVPNQPEQCPTETTEAAGDIMDNVVTPQTPQPPGPKTPVPVQQPPITPANATYTWSGRMVMKPSRFRD